MTSSSNRQWRPSRKGKAWASLVLVASAVLVVHCKHTEAEFNSGNSKQGNNIGKWTENMGPTKRTRQLLLQKIRAFIFYILLFFTYFPNILKQTTSIIHSGKDKQSTPNQTTITPAQQHTHSSIH